MRIFIHLTVTIHLENATQSARYVVLQVLFSEQLFFFTFFHFISYYII
jgi:hypothetical protein